MFSGPYAHDGLCWAAVEFKAFFRDVNFDWSAVHLTLLLEQPRKTQKFCVQAFTSLALSFFLLKLIHIVVLVSSTCKIDVFSGHSRFFIELDIQYFLRPQHNWGNQVEVQQHKQLIRGARLEKAMLNVAETYVYFFSFNRAESDSILVDFKIAQCLFAYNIRPYHKIFQLLLTTTFDHNQLL